ncbi:MAG: hypothetical protein ACFE0P_06510 [Oceanicaulis sp.]
MSDILTLVLVLGASIISVALLVVLNLFLGGWTPARFSQAEAGVRAIEEGVLGFRGSAEAVMARSGRVVLVIEAGGGRLGVAATSGDRATVRALRPGEVKAVQVEGATLTLDLDDYTFPRAWLTLDDAASAQDWARRAEGFTAARASERPGPQPASSASHA